MSRIQVKNLPRLKLSDLLRRRKMTLRQLLDEFGITTYDSLLERCNRMGVAPPTEDEFLVVAPLPVNNPSEGVFVIEIEATPEQIAVATVQLNDQIESEAEATSAAEETRASQKKQKKKKDDLQGKFNE